jgi:hypothetical protein
MNRQVTTTTKEAETQIFTYTANRSSHSGIAMGFTVMIIFEAAALEVLVGFLVSIVWLKLLLLGLMIGAHIYLLVWLFAPLWTKHRLTATQLKLRYGLFLKIDLPLEKLGAAQGWHKPLKPGEVIQPRYVKTRQRIVAVFSEQNQVLLQLKEPTILRVGLFKKRLTGEILINVDRRADFLRALKLPGVVINGDQELETLAPNPS